MLGLTAGATAEHGQRLKHHLVEEQSHGFVVQMVFQQEAVIVHVPPLTRDRHPLTHTHKQYKSQVLKPGLSNKSRVLCQGFMYVEKTREQQRHKFGEKTLQPFSVQVYHVGFFF